MDRMTKWIAALLRIARAIYVVAATAAILVTMIGLVVALYFEIVMTKGPNLVAVPTVPQTALLAVTADPVDNRLKPPTNLRIVFTRPVIDHPLIPKDVLGHFQVDTFNGLARYPDDLDILGGKDSDLFDRADGGSLVKGQGAALIPTAKFIEQVNSALRSGVAPRQYAFTLVAVAHDIYGVPSQVTDINFSLTYGTAPPATTPPKQSEPAVAKRGMSDLERLAHEIALIAGSEGSAAYQTTYTRAQRELDACGTSENDSDFIVSYRQLFDHARQRLTATNLAAFFDGVCDSWHIAIGERARAQASATAAQYAAMNANRSAEAQYQYEAAAAWVSRNATLIVVGSAFGTFLTICFLLAFLAMENHSNAIRNALAAISENRRTEQ